MHPIDLNSLKYALLGVRWQQSVAFAILASEIAQKEKKNSLDEKSCGKRL